MDGLSSKFSLYEMLRILIPGVLIATNIGIANDVLQTDFFLTISDTFYRAIIFFLFAFISGLLVYSFDIPKRTRFFQNDLPSKKLKTLHLSKSEVVIANSYFSFYDSLPAEQKKKTEIYSGFFHFAINLAFCSLLSCVVLYFVNKHDLKGLILLNITFFISTLIISLIIYYSRLRFSFQRHFDAYLKSNFYHEFINS